MSEPLPPAGSLFTTLVQPHDSDSTHAFGIFCRITLLIAAACLGYPQHICIFKQTVPDGFGGAAYDVDLPSWIRTAAGQATGATIGPFLFLAQYF